MTGLQATKRVSRWTGFRSVASAGDDETREPLVIAAMSLSAMSLLTFAAAAAPPFFTGKLASHHVALRALRAAQTAAMLSWIAALIDASTISSAALQDKNASASATLVGIFLAYKIALALGFVYLFYILSPMSSDFMRAVDWARLDDMASGVWAARASRARRRGAGARGAAAAASSPVATGQDAAADDSSRSVDIDDDAESEIMQDDEGAGSAEVLQQMHHQLSRAREHQRHLQRQLSARSGVGASDDTSAPEGDGSAAGGHHAPVNTSNPLTPTLRARGAAAASSVVVTRADKHGDGDALKSASMGMALLAHQQVVVSAVHSQALRWKVPALLMFAALFGYVVYEYGVTVSQQGALVPDSLLLELHSGPNSAAVPSPHKAWPASARQNKVVVIMLDGTRFDRTSEVAAFKELVTDPVLSRDAKLHEAKARVPTMSIPNWLSILTGGNPELHGVLGNILIPETAMDTMFSVAKAYHLNRGIAASPPFEAIILSMLPLLKGAAVVDYSYGQEDLTAPSNWEMDEVLTNITVQALAGAADSGDPYRLWLLYNNDVDLQGHTYGVTTTYNPDDTYNKAVADKIANVRRVLDSVDNDTVVIVTADHGHVDPGGHGGMDPKLFGVPLWVYKRDSNLSSYVYDGPSLRPSAEEAEEATPNDAVAGDYSTTLLDIAPTVCTLLGMSPPGTSQGVILPEAWALVPPEARLAHHQALVAQQQRLAFNVLTAVRPVSLTNSASGADVLRNSSLCDTVQDCADRMVALRQAYADARELAIEVEQAALLSFSLFLILLTLGYFSHALLTNRFARPAAIVPCASCRGPSGPRARACRRACGCRGDLAYFVGGGAAAGAGEDSRRRAEQRLGHVRRTNALAFGAAFALVAGYYTATVLLVYLVFLASGYDTLDSTLLAHETVLEKFFLTALAGAVVLTVVLVGGFHTALARVASTRLPSGPPGGSCGARLGALAGRVADRTSAVLRRGGAVLHPGGVYFTDLGLLYLWKLYMLFLVMVVVCVTMAIRSSYELVSPWGVRILWLYGETWVLRFQVMMVQTISLPLVLAAIVVFLRHPAPSRVGGAGGTGAWPSLLLLVAPMTAAERDEAAARGSHASHASDGTGAHTANVAWYVGKPAPETRGMGVGGGASADADAHGGTGIQMTAYDSAA